jgi:hypothetical protein
MYSLNEEERSRFSQAVSENRRGSDSASYAVGLFRSHTREGLGLCEDDVKLFDELFPESGNVILLVKPYATRASRAGFFFREDGVVHGESSYAEFPFRRSDLGGETGGDEEAHPATSASASDSGTISATGWTQADPGQSYAAESPATARSVMASEPTTGILGINQPPPPPSAGEPGPNPSRRGWIWLPLSFIFLLLGVFLGIQVSVSVGQKMPGVLRPGDPLALNLSAAPAGESVHLRWDRNSSVVRSAQRGRLIISDGGAEKTVALTPDQLQFGSVIYHRGSPEVQFRFEIEIRERVTLSEILTFRAP